MVTLQSQPSASSRASTAPENPAPMTRKCLDGMGVLRCIIRMRRRGRNRRPWLPSFENLTGSGNLYARTKLSGKKSSRLGIQNPKIERSSPAHIHIDDNFEIIHWNEYDPPNRNPVPMKFSGRVQFLVHHPAFKKAPLLVSWRLLIWLFLQKLGQSRTINIHHGSRMRLYPLKHGIGAPGLFYIFREDFEETISHCIRTFVREGSQCVH